MTLLQQWGSSDLDTEFKKIAQYIASMPMIDIGVIRRVKGEIADVQLCSTGSTYLLELITPGSGHGTAFPVSAGQYCIVFATASAVELTKGLTRLDKEGCDITMAKAMPIGIMPSSAVSINAEKDSLSIGSKNYTAFFLEELFQLVFKDMSLSVSDEAASISNSVASCEMSQTGIEILAAPEYDKTTAQLNSIGGRLSIADTGAMTLETNVDVQNKSIGGRIKIDDTGVVTVETGIDEQNSEVKNVITINTDGTVKMTAKDILDIETTTDGNLTITPQGAFTVATDGGMKFDGDVEITGKLTVAGTNLTVDK